MLLFGGTEQRSQARQPATRALQYERMYEYVFLRLGAVVSPEMSTCVLVYLCRCGLYTCVRVQSYNCVCMYMCTRVYMCLCIVGAAEDALAVESALPPAWTFDAQLGAPTALREASEEECRRRAGRLPTLGDVKEVAAGRPDAAFPPKAPHNPLT